ncbi:MAG: hypothetical protein K2Y51_18690 [Gammaproteobacteria bacterium]|nr:hypothetical protein [Gammaproteobacteria bacterium]
MMRISLSALTLLGLLSSAQAQLLDEQQLRLLMEQAQGIEACMTRLDPAAMAEVRRRGEQVSAEIQSLCAAGKRDEAQARAVAFGQEMAASPAMNGLEDCGGPLAALVPGAIAGMNGDSSDSVQVCDMQQ